MTLPSNSSMNYYEDNTTAQFTTKLAQTIELDGDWEVGLSSIGVPAEVENVIAKECYCNIYYDDVLKWIVTLPPGDYYRISHVIDALHSEQRRTLGQNVIQILRFTHINSRKRVMVSIHSSIMRRVKFEFSLDLARMIGFKAGTIYLGKDVPMTGEKPLDLASNMNSFYVYCDLLQPILVGDTKVPLLRIVDKTEKKEGMAYRTMNPIQYVPLQKKCFDTIQIKLATDTGVVVPFFPENVWRC